LSITIPRPRITTRIRKIKLPGSDLEGNKEQDDDARIRQRKIHLSGQDIHGAARHDP
jgi:hypothetical protein